MERYDVAENDEFKVEIFYDESPESPRDDDGCLAHMAFFNMKDGYGDEEFRSRDVAVEWVEKHKETSFVFPVRAYIHSGTSFSVSKDGTWGYPYTDQFDSGNAGIIMVSVDEMKGMGMEDISIDGAFKIAEEELKVYNQWLNGEVYGFRCYPKVQLYRKEGKKYVPHCVDIDESKEDSCWGFYDIKDIKEHLPEGAQKLCEKEGWWK